MVLIVEEYLKRNKRYHTTWYRIFRLCTYYIVKHIYQIMLFNYYVDFYYSK